MTVDHLKLLHAMGGKGETSEFAACKKKKNHFLAFYASVSPIVCEASIQKALEVKTNFIPQLLISV